MPGTLPWSLLMAGWTWTAVMTDLVGSPFTHLPSSTVSQTCALYPFQPPLPSVPLVLHCASGSCGLMTAPASAARFSDTRPPDSSNCSPKTRRSSATGAAAQTVSPSGAALCRTPRMSAPAEAIQEARCPADALRSSSGLRSA